MTIRGSQSALAVCTAMVLLATNSEVYAQDAATSEGGTVLERIVVKGKRVVPGSVADTPLATETTAAQIEKKQITTIMDLGRTQEPGVSFNRTTGSVNIRGLEDSRVLTTVDGIPLTFLSDATRNATGGLDTFDFSSLSAVDVVRGADSSRAGPGALGGVLAIRTLEPEDLIGEGRTWGGIAKFNYDSSDRSFSPSAAVASKIANTSILFQGSYRKGHERDNKGQVDSLGATRTKPNPVDYDQYNLLFKLRQELEGGHTIGLTAERFSQDKDIDPLTLLSATGNYRPGNYRGDEGTERDRISIDYKYEAFEKDGLIDAASASLYWQKQVKLNGYDAYRFGTATNTLIGPISRLNDYEQNGFGLVGTVEKNFTTGDYDHRLVFGYDLYTGFAEQYSQGVDSCATTTPRPAACGNLHTNQADTPKVDTNRIGFYVDDLIEIGSTGFSLNPGIRFDWLEHTPKMTVEFDRNASNPSLPAAFSDTAISPKLRAGYEVNDKLEFYGQWAMGFRAPTSGELYAAFGGPGTYLRLGNPNLESETSNGFEIGANIGDDDFGGRVNLFYNRYKNFIDTRSLNTAEAAALGYVLGSYPQGGITQNINLDRARIYGAEISAHKRFDNGFSVRTGVAYANGKDLDTGAFLKSVAPLKAVAGVAYDTESWGVGLDWIGVAEARGQTTTTAAGPTTTINYLKTPGYGIFDLTAWWEPEQVKGLKINAGIYNVFDKTYYDYATARNGGSQPASFYTEPGRSFKISLTQKF
ncbi:TonB-dependent hemoglobin/transferrin/lactoferrin family receptor [Rhizobium sp. Leaf262]|uniref:TonB-dependent hemoglobin/transferrin/lactoferrin family receptor n=1 Tax=Rhizobium sp. Leaf262 TaxID=1736312 RepID=UPI000713419F|nr:TonB-dependent hemoglobin/transferrin/lactoferrin family receptor [Rhizobium sp. Leaf262]KQO82152.1 cation transporter [Rhizobium sp. Leaf262]